MTQRIVGSFWALIFTIIMVGAYVVIPATAVFAEDGTTTPTTDTTAQTATTSTDTTTPTATDSTTTTPTTDTTTPTATDSTTTTPTTDTTIAPSADTTTTTTTPGPQTPVGPDANTYTYNETTGLWENDYYTWDPVTKQTQPKTPVDYSYNPTTGYWDTTAWVFDPATNKYQENVISTPAPQLTQQQQQLVDSLPATQGALLRALLLPSAQQGPGANSTITSQSTNKGFFDLFHNASISNTINSQATTGDAIVTTNTLGGNATTGNAKAIANLFNMLNSSIGFLGGANPLFFTANILGNILGDLLINPGQLPANTPTQQQSSDTNLKVQSQNTGTINNDVQLLANSGAATVANNTQAGNASSGDAYAMANIMNSINSVIGSGQSFMGMINIYGNLNGDILLPPGFINSLLASNTQAPQTTVAVTDPYNTNIQNATTTNANFNLNDTNAINNNLAVSAASGSALVGNNTSAGNATTGSANTNVTLLNLTGKQVVGKNALLVFVNVLGSWVGLIMNAPNGVTAGVIGDASASMGNVNSTQNNNIDVTSSTKNSINNNLDIRAKTGDASVVNNTSAGNATSGNALAAVNILNMSNSAFSLSDWFGILFINVLGNWTGSFGVDTSAGNPINTPSPIPGSSSSPQVFSFVPATTKKTTTATSRSGSEGTQTTSIVSSGTPGNNSNGSTQVLAAHSSTAPTNRGFNMPWLLFSFGLILLILFGDRARNFIAQLRLNRA